MYGVSINISLDGGHLNIPGDFSCGGSMVQRFVRSGSLDDAKSGEECYNQYKSTYKAPEFESKFLTKVQIVRIRI